MTENNKAYRKIIGWVLILVGILIWIPSGDVIDMIVREKEIVFGRYSRGHFSALFLLSIILFGIAWLCFSRISSIKEMAITGLLVSLSTGLTIFLLVLASGWIFQPRYIEQVVKTQEGEQTLSGIVRHRPPNEFYQLVEVDKPEQARSYPDAPPGYPGFDVTLTTDQYGFRNQTESGELLSEYPVLVVGDSFAAGSHVSDEQAWSLLLSKQISQPVYNLGVSGSNPGNYYNNFMLLGRRFNPRLVIFMIYEGNDFKKVSPLLSELNGSQANKTEATTEQPTKELSYWLKASPVTKGLKRFSAEVLEQIGKGKPVPGYSEQVGFMPIALQFDNFQHHYSFPPKRLMYLYTSEEKFAASRSWQRISEIMSLLVERGKMENYEVLFVYAPSTPHVVLPLAREQIPAEQLHRFASFREDDLPDPETFEQRVFDWLDSEQAVFTDYCDSRAMHCLVLTDALRAATAEGQQLYFTYDQHWTPEGNRVVAEIIARKLAAESLY